MTPDAGDDEKLRKSYSDLRTRLLAERDREETRVSESREILRRIAKELAAVERDQRRLEGAR